MNISQMIAAGYRACVSRKINAGGDAVEIWWWWLGGQRTTARGPSRARTEDRDMIGASPTKETPWTSAK
jgi:hypothetical protein